MPKASPVQTAWNAGELSPRMVARIDYEKYDNAGAIVENLLALPQGGLTRRPGTRYIANAKISNALSILIPFAFSDEQTYQIEAGAGYFRFFRNQGQITTPVISTAISNGAFAANITGWTDRSAGTGAIAWDAGNGGQMELVGAGSGNEARAYQSLSVAAGDQGKSHNLAFTVRDFATSLRIGTSAGDESILALTAFDPGTHILAFASGSATVVVEFEQPASLTSHVDDVSISAGGAVEIATPYASTDLYQLGYAQSADVMWIVHPGYKPRKLTRTGHASWSLTDYAPLDDPFTAPDDYPSAVCFFEQRLWFAATNNQPQTLWATASANYEDMTLSSAGAVLDDDAIEVTIASDQVNRIRWLSPGRDLVIGTIGGEFIASSAGGFITPSDISIRRHTAHGSAAVLPVRVGSVVLWLQRAGRKVYEGRVKFEEDGLVATDLNRLADHITESGIVQMAYAQDPDSILWAVRADGQLAALTYKPEEDVVGWTRQIIGGSFGGDHPTVQSVSTIQGQATGQVTSSLDRDEVWLIVRRTIDGATTRTIEMVEGAFVGPRVEDYDTEAAWKAAMLSAQQDAFYVDCGLTYDGVSATVISGLDHLEGETVKVLGDGAVLPDAVVESGAVTLDVAVSKAQIGLPARWRLKSLKMPHGGAAGPGILKTKRVHRIGLAMDSTATFQLGIAQDGLYPVEFRVVGDAMDTAVPLFTGEIVEPLDSQHETDPRIWLIGDTPSPFTLLAWAPEMETHDVR